MEDYFITIISHTNIEFYQYSKPMCTCTCTCKWLVSTVQSYTPLSSRSPVVQMVS